MFVNLHTHDAFGSLLDSIIKPSELAEFASKNGQIAIASTNHGYMSSFVEFHKACLKNNVKPIHGCEIYECDDDTEKADTKDYKQPRYHLVLLAKNKTGLQNLFKIVSFACTDGFYKKPLVTIDRIKENGWGKGIVCLTACQAGRFSRLIADENYAELQNYIEKSKDCFDDVFCEIQAHKTPDQMVLNRRIVDFAYENHLKTVVTTDAHMLSPDQSDSHAIFVEIGEGREVGETYTDCYLQTENEVREKLGGYLTESEINEAISNTEVIANSIELIDIGLTDKAVMPKVEIQGDFDSHEEYLRYLVYRTFDEKFGHLSKEEQDKRRQRIEEELPVLYAVHYTDYFIMLYMLIDAFRKANIPLGYARGSAAGSLCLYMLNVTQIDSVRWKLDFSRFANLGRTSMADCDIDISRKKRRLAVDITADLFGRDKVAPICTFNSLSTKVAIRDVGKVLNEKESSPYFGKIPYSLRDEVAKMIPTIKTLNDLGEEEDKDTLLRDVLLKNEKLQEVYEQFPLWFKHVMAVEGLPKSMGRHAAGTLITPEPIVTYCPTCYDADKNVMVQLEMHSAMDDLGLIKMDLLGLKTLDVIDDALSSANLSWDDVDINHLNLDDDRVYKDVYRSGNTIGIFQMESYEAKRMCIESEADDIENIVVVNAANRPGTKDSFPEYCQNKLHPELESPVHLDLKKIFKASHGILLYQEQALQVFRYAGFPESEVDNARRCVDENTLITMGDGSQKKIKDIVVGDTVISLSNNGSFTPKKVTAVFDNGVKPTSILKTKHEYSLIATENHKVFTDSGWKEIKDIDKSIFLFTPTNIKTNWADIAGNKKPSDSDMFLIGLLIGDGSIGNEDAVHFTNSEDVVIKRFVSCLSNIGNKSYKATYNISVQDGVDVEKIYSIYPTELCKNRLLQLLKKYNLVHFAGDKNIPNEFLSYAPTSKIKNLLGGLFNTDGGYCESQSAIEYYTKSKILALQIKYLLLKYGIYSYVYSKRANGYDYEVFTLRISDPTSLVKFGEEIVPFVCGRKKDDYIRIIDISNNNDLKYNYMLPLSCSQEVLNSILESNKSISEIATQCGYNENSLKISTSFKLTDTKARKIIQHLYCPNTYKILSSDARPIEIVSKSEYGYSHVYDIEVEDTHNYVANGLVVHNCIGKKDAKRMTDLQTRLIDGLKLKGWSDEQCSAIWDLLLKQALYSFNRSHAVAYGLLSYLTAYLKVHYPVEFMAACLTNDSDNVSKISIFVNEAKRIGINVLPPHINRSEKYFTPIAEKNQILFGLLAIKGLGESAIEQIMSMRPYNGVEDVFTRVQNRSAIISLIKSGAIPTKDKMKLMRRYAEWCYTPLQYKEVSSLPTKSKLLIDWDIDVERYKVDKKVDKERVLQIYNNLRKQKFDETNDVRQKSFMDDFYGKYAKDEFLWEFETLSMFVTHDPLCEANRYMTVQWNDVLEGEVGVVVAVVVDIERKKDKNGNLFLYVDLYTPFGIIESTCWSAQTKKYGYLVKKCNCIAIRGRKAEGGHLFVEDMKPYDQWLKDRKIKMPCK